MSIIACLRYTRLLLGGIALVWSSTMSAQEDSTAFRPQTYIGAQYGMNWNTVMFSPQVDQETLVANRIGGVFRYIGQPHLGIQLELAYDQRGWSESIDSLTTNYTRELNYLEFAAFSHISIGKGAVRPLILLGSYLSYPISQQETIPADWDPERFTYYGEMVPERLQYGLAGGLGLELHLGSVSFQVDGRYRSALGGIYPSSDSRFIFSNSQGFTAQASLLFRIFGGGE